jgi:hypothetical protein
VPPQAYMFMRADEVEYDCQTGSIDARGDWFASRSKIEAQKKLAEDIVRVQPHLSAVKQR